MYNTMNRKLTQKEQEIKKISARGKEDEMENGELKRTDEKEKKNTRGEIKYGRCKIKKNSELK